MAVQKYKKRMIYPINIKGKTKKQVAKLNLSGRGLTVFPENVFDYPNLTKLVLSNNRIKVIPKEILKLKKLKVLDLANNEIAVLHGAVFKLPKLRTLNVYGNQIRKLPKQVMESGLQKLIVGKNPIEDTELDILEDKFEVVCTKKEIKGKEDTEFVSAEMPQKDIAEKVKENMIMDKKHRIFISYSHEDDKWLTKVLKNLKSLQRYYDNVDSWSDKKIMASDVWKDEIDKALGNATIAILLVSPDFMASDFITKEELQPILNKAVGEGTKILTLILRPTPLLEESGLLKYQAVNDPKKPLTGMTEFEQETVLVNLVEAIKRIIDANEPKKQKDAETPKEYSLADEEGVRDIVRKYKPSKR